MRRLLLLAVFLASPAAGLAAEVSSLEERMGQAQFRAAGLHKLSLEELTALEAWLKAQDPAGAIPADRPDAASPQGGLGTDARTVRTPIVSRISGEFTGFDGRTRFELQNGQVWQQHGDDTVLVGMRLQAPEVTIRPSRVGSAWYLEVEGFNKRAKVRRIR